MEVAQVALKRNIRWIWLDLKAESIKKLLQNPSQRQTLQAFKNHSFKIVCSSDEAINKDELHRLPNAPFIDSFCPRSKNADALHEIAAKIQMPLARTLHVTEPDSHPKNGQTHEAIRVDDKVVGWRMDHDNEVGEDVAASMNRLADALLFNEQELDKTKERCFGRFPVQFSQIFYDSANSFALVNLKPIVRGHVLVLPKRRVDRFEKLDADEVSDLWSTAQLVGKKLERYFNAEALTFSIQDGKAAGQTVDHVHIHVIPRNQGDFERNDDVYAEIERNERILSPDNDKRIARTQEEMAQEADELRQLF